MRIGAPHNKHLSDFPRFRDSSSLESTLREGHQSHFHELSLLQPSIIQSSFAGTATSSKSNVNSSLFMTKDPKIQSESHLNRSQALRIKTAAHESVAALNMEGSLTSAHSRTKTAQFKQPQSCTNLSQQYRGEPRQVRHYI